MKKGYKVFILALCMMPLIGTAFAAGNATSSSFLAAKHVLEHAVYGDHRETFYCMARYSVDKKVELPSGFITPKFEHRAEKIEWEHIVPAENFGRAFHEWREGDILCVDNRGKPYKGRKCAEKASGEYRLMQADMHNIVPAIGSVNAMRKNFRFTQLSESVPATFGSCQMKIDERSRIAEPPKAVRGAVSRTYKYMAWAYPNRFRLSGSQAKLFEKWDRMYPPTYWECVRQRRIATLQGNSNPFVSTQCR